MYVPMYLCTYVFSRLCMCSVYRYSPDEYGVISTTGLIIEDIARGEGKSSIGATTNKQTNTNKNNLFNLNRLNEHQKIQ